MEEPRDTPPEAAADPSDDVLAAAVQNAGQVMKRPTDVDIGIDRSQFPKADDEYTPEQRRDNRRVELETINVLANDLLSQPGQEAAAPGHNDASDQPAPAGH